MKPYFIILLFFFTVFSSELLAQKKFMHDGVSNTDQISTSDFNNKLFQEILLYKLNTYLDSIGLEGFEAHDFFLQPAMEHARMMQENDNLSLIERGKHKTVRDRLISCGGTGVGAELITKQSTKIMGEAITYEELASQVTSRWTGGKSGKTLFEQNYFFAMPFACVDDSEKRIYISMYIGNYSSFTQNKDNEGSLSVAISTKKYGLLPYDDKICRRFKRRIANYIDLQKGLSIDSDGKIIFEYDNLKKISRFMKDPKDGLAVDIIQKSQFDCNSENIIDYSNINYGYMTKPLFVKHLFGQNFAEGEGRKNKQRKLKVVMGELSDTFQPEDIELNLMIIKDDYLCANINKSWIDSKSFKTIAKITLLPDTVETENSRYAPVATSSELRFRIPFEQGKYNYDPHDIEPLIHALDEPKFIINKIYITAYSSLEGSNATNQNLQKKRAQSIVKALEKHQNASIVDSIVTKTNFEDFKNDIAGTKYEEAAKFDIQKATKYANSKAKEMEDILKNHRYADVVIWVTYETQGELEQDYVVRQFNESVDSRNIDYALKIQKYILKRVVEGRYNVKVLEDMKIPQDTNCIGLNMNKIWLNQHINMDEIDEEYYSKINKLNKLDNSNIYVEYNDILATILVKNLENKSFRDRLQNRIKHLYNTNMGVNYVDLLNIELQYQVMDIYKDSLGYDNPLVIECMNNIKQIIKFEKLNWQNSLKLANVFISHADYKYAVYLLEPFISKEDTPFIVLSTYITACSKVENKTQSNKFVIAVERALKEDKDFFCNLYKDGKFSIQTLTNTKLKEIYCKTCK